VTDLGSEVGLVTNQERNAKTPRGATFFERKLSGSLSKQKTKPKRRRLILFCMFNHRAICERTQNSNGKQVTTLCTTPKQILKLSSKGGNGGMSKRSVRDIAR